MRFCVILWLTISVGVAFAAVRPTVKAATVNTCLSCHQGIEEIHPKPVITCVGCHFGNERATAKAAAHRGMVRNPSDLRWVDKTCGRVGCHRDVAHRVKRSIMATGAGEISGTFYMRGLQSDKEQATYHVGPVVLEALEGRKERMGVWEYGSMGERDKTPTPPHPHTPILPYPHTEGAVAKLHPLPSYAQTGNPFFDLFRKECSQCHLWQEGVKRKGDYRASGCAACHVVYADDGLSQSSDPTIPKDVGGHPIKHQITTRIPTFQCAHCHNRGNRVGMNFQGKMETSLRFDQYPQDVLHGQDYKDELPDVHHEKGMACIDCHTEAEVHGDGHIYRKKIYQLEIRCESCHGTADAPATLKTGKGRPLRNLKRKDGKVVLVSKVDGREYVVPQLLLSTNTVTNKRMGSGASSLLFAHSSEALRDNATVVGNGRRAVPQMTRTRRPKSSAPSRQNVRTSSPHVLRNGTASVPYRNGTASVPYRSAMPAMNVFVNSLSHSLTEKRAIAHSNHIRLECYTCHSAWTPQCVGCHIRMDFTRYERPVYTAFDHVARRETDLGWFKTVNGVRTADPEPPLGVNHRGKIAPFMAGVHTVLTHVNEQGQTEYQFRLAPTTAGLLSVAAPSIPHTVRKEARPCASCHRSDKALGVGSRTTADMPKLKPFAPPDYPWDRIVDALGNWLQDTPLHKARPLNREEMERIRNAPIH